MAKKKVNQEVMDKPDTPTGHIYDPKLSYTWTQEQEFSLKGDEFDIVLNALNEYCKGNRNIQAIGLIIKAQQIMQDKLKQGVEQGQIIEKT